MHLIAEDLTIDRGERRLVAGLSFAVAPGQALVVTGENGAGKSTLLRVVAGLVAQTSGRLRTDPPQNDDDPPLAARAHYIGHSDALKTALTPLENLAFWQAMLGDGPGVLSPAEALAQGDLTRLADLPVRYLSSGQKRRVALARLLVAARPLWLLDEPTGALDVASRERFAKTMQAHLDTGGSILAATHVPLGLAKARELRIGRPS